METDKSKSLFSAAGFRVGTPQTAKQQELYALPSNKVERAKVKDEVFYVFKDKKAGVPMWAKELQHKRISSSVRSST